MMSETERYGQRLADSQVMEEFIRGLNNGSYKWHQFYDIVDPSIFPWFEIQNKFNFSKRPKKMPLLFFDIETDNDENVFPDTNIAKWPVNSVSLFNNITRTLYLFFIPPQTAQDKTLSQWKSAIEKLYFETLEEHSEYKKIGEISIECFMYNNDKQLLTDFFKTVHKQQSVSLIGYNSSIFDIPYIFNRLKNISKDWKSIASIYKQVSTFGNQFEIPDLSFIDLLHLYKPQSAGGMAFGKARLSYKLDFIANVELGIGKLEYDGSLYRLYRDDPVRFFVYNIFDSILLELLNNKLFHVDALYGLAQFSNSPMSKALIGRSLLYQFSKVKEYWDKDKAIISKLYNSELMVANASG